MAILNTDSLISRRIASAFFNFIDSVEHAPGVDVESLEVVKDCLAEVFKLCELPESERPEPNLLVNIFSSHGSVQTEATTNHRKELVADGGPSETSEVQGAVEVREDLETGVAEDELFVHFFDALERRHVSSTTPNGADDNVFLDRATAMFHDAINEMVGSGCGTLDAKSLADALKTLGNKAMQSKLYGDAIERYTCAIALCENAVFYCNRAAAYTNMQKYDEAIKDCRKSIEMDPNYSKAYSRLGLAYYGQGSYSDAINEGFRKALELDPNNDDVKKNIEVAEQKLRGEQEQRRRHQETRNQGAPSPFGSMSFGTGIPANLASIFSQMSGNVPQEQNGPAEDNGGAQFTARSFDGTANPAVIASMFMNMPGNAFPGQNPGNGFAEQNNGSEPANQFSSSMLFDASALPGDLAGMFRNMAEGGANINVGGINDPGIGIGGANISLNLGEQTPEDLTQTLRSVMGMFSGGVPTDPPQGNTDGESQSR